MAYQELYVPNRVFTLDLHGVRTRDAVRAIKLRLAECYRYGIRALKCVYGSPDRFEGSIPQALCQLLVDDEHVRTSELPSWVIDADPVEGYPIFVVVPIRLNPQALLLDDKTSFDKFKAVHEEHPGKQLLCQMPFQPLRQEYDWTYAAKAIGRGCTDSELKKMCKTKGAFDSDSGLSLSQLMTAAEDWRTWKKKSKVTPQITCDIMTLEPAAAPSTPAQVFFESLHEPDVPARLKAFDRYIASADYDKAESILDSALENGDPAVDFELCLRKARLLFVQHNRSCEEWLQRADALIKADSGTTSVKRVPILTMLTSWYAEVGEPTRAIDCASELGGVLGPRTLSKMDHKRHFLNQLAVASLLRATGNIMASTRTIHVAFWEDVLRQDGDAPPSFPMTESQVLGSGINRALISRAFTFCALNMMDAGNIQQSSAYLVQANNLLPGGHGHDGLRAAIAQGRGRVFRKEGNIREAVRCYSDALRLNNTSGAPDLNLEYEINTSLGVAYAGSDSAQADRYYQAALTISKGRAIEESPYHAKLLISIATLRLRQRRYQETISTGNQAVEMLLLRAPDAHIQIGLALLRVGVAMVETSRSTEAVGVLLQAQQEADHCGPSGAELKAAILQQLARARSGDPNVSASSQSVETLQTNGRMSPRDTWPRFDEEMTKDKHLGMVEYAFRYVTDDGMRSPTPLPKTARQEAEHAKVVRRIRAEYEGRR